MWRLLEVGERIESGDEWYNFRAVGPRWEPYAASIGHKVAKFDNPGRRRVPSPGAEISAEKDRPDNLVKLGDRVGINCGTWFGCTGRVTRIISVTLVRVELDNVYAGGNRLTIAETLDNVTMLVEPVAETLSLKNCPVCGVIA